jgi:uncharacterized protein (TIGR03435 family)
MRIYMLPAMLLLAICAAAQQPKFETASVKRAECTINNSIDPGMISLKGDPLKPVLVEAFHVRADQIEGPAWLDTECFDIIAKMPEGAPPDQLGTMLQALLAERFGLTVHKETRQRPGYSLVVDKGGPKCPEDDPNTNFMGGRGTMMLRRGGGGIKKVMTMAELAAYLSGRGYGPVVDVTGLTAKYDINLSWAPDPDFEHTNPLVSLPEHAPPAPTVDLFTAVREQLGLRLDRRTVPMEFLVIDHIDRVPTGN